MKKIFWDKNPKHINFCPSLQGRWCSACLGVVFNRPEAAKAPGTCPGAARGVGAPRHTPHAPHLGWEQVSVRLKLASGMTLFCITRQSNVRLFQGFNPLSEPWAPHLLFVNPLKPHLLAFLPTSAKEYLVRSYMRNAKPGFHRISYPINL